MFDPPRIHLERPAAAPFPRVNQEKMGPDSARVG